MPAAAFSPTITLEPAGPGAGPLYLRLARAIARDISRGRLRPGDRLPGTRTLAVDLQIHRSTVVAAYADLAAQGWTVSRPAGATLVAPTSPDADLPRAVRSRGRATSAGLAATPGFALPPSGLPRLLRPAELRPTPRGALPLWGGVPDIRLCPNDLLGRALRRAVRQQGGQLLQYATDRRGHPRLRGQLAGMLAAIRGLPAGADDVIITQGSQMALDLIARCLLGPGDAVAVEGVGYRPAWAALSHRGARLVPVPVDDEGMDVDRLAELAAVAPDLRAVYLTPQHHYPTTVVLSARRRAALLNLARQRRLCIIEDDYDHEFHYEGRPALPLISGDEEGRVLYVGSLAKILAPGLRIGFVVGPRAVIDRLAEERALVDRHGPPVLEAAVADLLEEGEVARHARRVRRIFRRRRDVLCAALARHLPEALAFRVPRGGMALWARVQPGIDGLAWHRRAQQAGVLFQSGADFSFDGRPLPYLRLGFAGCDERELETAARRLARCLPGRR
jgi:GntR family transcriptional regulator / MocR family aminotransferase